jgi:transcriptional regulator with XRE-family HTH domain
MDSITHISKKIKMARLGKGWTQEKLAKKSNLTSRTIINVEGGKGLNVATLSAIADALECPVVDLLRT